MVDEDALVDDVVSVGRASHNTIPAYVLTLSAPQSSMAQAIGTAAVGLCCVWCRARHRWRRCGRIHGGGVSCVCGCGMGVRGEGRAAVVLLLVVCCVVVGVRINQYREKKQRGGIRRFFGLHTHT